MAASPPRAATLWLGAAEEGGAGGGGSSSEELAGLEEAAWESRGRAVSGGCRWRQAALAGASLPALALLALSLRNAAGPGRPALAEGGNEVVLGEDKDNCGAYFRGWKDCSKQNYWECSENDGSWGYACCCFDGWGEFGSEKEDPRHTTSMVSWKAHPDLCLDVSTPYAYPNGPDFTSGPFFVQVCAFGDPNKQFHLPRAGAGQIRWAPHPHLCLGVKEDEGDRVYLMHCRNAPSELLRFSVNPVDGAISWAAHPERCLSGGGEDGALVKLDDCKPGDPGQQFEIMDHTPMPEKFEPPTLFCVSLMMPFGSELALVRMQFERQIGIFECAETGVYSNVSITFRHENRSWSTELMEGSLVVKIGGPWHTALNTDVFIRLWSKVVSDSRSRTNPWTAKLDPDCVFFPRRLQQLARSIYYNGDPKKKAVFLNNCHLGMHGPIEVLSSAALSIYRKRWRECKNGAPYAHKQEDYYFWECWKLLRLERVESYNLLLENKMNCDERSSTRDGRHPCFSKQISFHPFKSTDSYLECHKRGAAMSWATPMEPLSENPTHFHFHG